MNSSLFFLSLGFVAFCIYMARHAWLSYQNADSSDAWPTTSGVLQDVHLWGTRNIDGEMVEAEKLRVSYEYEIDGTRYSGSEIAFYKLHYPETIEFAKDHPQDSNVKVFYNPSKHSESVLISGAHPTKPYGGIILAILGLLVSVAVSVGAWLEF